MGENVSLNLKSRNSKMTANFKLNDTKVTGAPETVNIPKKKKPSPVEEKPQQDGNIHKEERANREEQDN